MNGSQFSAPEVDALPLVASGADDPACSVDGCHRTIECRGLCTMHYSRWKRNGHTDLLDRSPGVCAAVGCEKYAVSKGYCKSHYERFRTGREVDAPMAESLKGRPLAERLEAQTDRTDDCWNWTGHLKDGYGYVKVGPIGRGAHRVMYEHLVGPISDGLEIDHLCRNRKCVNPDHLEPVTRRVNVLRGESTPAINARKTHCHRGHEFTPENTRILGGPCGPRRDCRTCEREREAIARLSDPAAVRCANCGLAYKSNHGLSLHLRKCDAANPHGMPRPDWWRLS